MFERGETVQYAYDSRIGQITGNRRGNKWEVRFGAVESYFLPQDQLARYNPDVGPWDLFVQRRFGGIKDLRNILARLRLSGELTNLMYSMGNSRTQFFPHQFVPVLKFLSSEKGRILVADEVGLGKTIEALYIWQELRARDNAYRLLVVSPAILKEKWIKDASDYFDLELKDVNATGLQSTLEKSQGRPYSLIASVQGLRAEMSLMEFLKKHEGLEPLFDLVIVDEAHYMRNDKTQSFALGEALRSTSKNILMLSATPIQTSSSNLFSLLRLLAPGEFESEWQFNRLLEDSKPLVRLANAVDRRDSQEMIRTLLVKALNTEAHGQDSDLLDLKRDFQALVATGDETPEHRARRLKIVQNLKSKYFYAPFVTRMRKRDVFEHRTKRTACTIRFGMSDVESRFYECVSNYLLGKDDGELFQTFRLIARQRQMASCMAAALATWRSERPPLADLDSDEDKHDMNMYFELEFGNDEWNSGQSEPMPHFVKFSLEELERSDTKFNCVLKQIKEILSKNSSERIVIFSFFRGTVAYLARRLNAVGVKTTFILGGLSAADKQSRIVSFKDGSCNVLVSSEVGSEGIDLQFARIEINYDLPWNPMRIEQRIGRIDRIGQKSEEIFIYNAYCTQTIEDKVLARLHGRIRLFEDVLGDVEDILGPTVEDIELKTFRQRRTLTEAQIEEMMEQIDTVRTNNEQIANDLRENAHVFSQYQKYVLDGIEESRRNKRTATDFELRFLVKEFLNSNYPGSSVSLNNRREVWNITLSDEARRDLSTFLESNKAVARTDLVYGTTPKACAFGSRPDGCVGHVEIIDINHAIVRFLVSKLNSLETASRCQSLRIPKSALPKGRFAPGMYVYYVQQWISNGVGRTNELHFFAKRCASGGMLGAEDAEILVLTAMMEGDSADFDECVNDNAGNAVNESGESVRDFGWTAEEAFENERTRLNEDEKRERLSYLTRDHAVQVRKLEYLIEKVGAEETNKNVILMNEGKLSKVRERFAEEKKKIESQKLQITSAEIAVGIINVEET